MNGDTGAYFQTTCWTLIHQAGQNRGELERLLRTYWSPVYAFIRRKGHNDHDAADLTQEFLTHVVLGRDLVARADPSRGTFRSFLKKSLRNFLIDKARVSKPAPLPLYDAIIPDAAGSGALADADPVPTSGASAAGGPSSSDPFDVFDRQWAATVVQQALDRTESACRADGLTQHWRAFWLNVVTPSTRRTTPLPMEELASMIEAASAEQASNMLQTVRRRFRRTLREVVAETVERPELVEQELGELKRLLD